MLWIPKGFAHGFLSLEDDTHFSYKCEGEYFPKNERTLSMKDFGAQLQFSVLQFSIDLNISEKDALGLSWEKAIKELG
jgi:dTDP-4-dehydrorhamnose 3,5-epimerase